VRTWAVLGAVLGDLGAVLGCLGAPWLLLSDLGAAGGDFESIWDRFGLDLGSIWIDLGSFGGRCGVDFESIWMDSGSIWVDCLIFLIFFGGLALMRSNVPQVSQLFF